MDATKGNGRNAGHAAPVKDLKKASSQCTKQARFTGATYPRHLSANQAYMTRPVTRELLDRIADCSNVLKLVAELRRRRLKGPSTSTKKKDRDLFDYWPGVYYLTPQGRRRMLAWLAKRKGVGHASA